MFFFLAKPFVLIVQVKRVTSVPLRKELSEQLLRLTIAWTPSKELAQMCLSDQHMVEVGLAACKSICLNCSSEAGNDAGNIKQSSEARSELSPEA